MLVKQGNVPEVSPGQLIAAGGILALLPATILYILTGFGCLPGSTANLLLLLTILAELFIVVLCAFLEDRHQLITKIIQVRAIAFLLGWTGWKSR